jgi:hypothetical protein
MLLGGVSPMSECRQQTHVVKGIAETIALVSCQSRRPGDRASRKGFVAVLRWIHERGCGFDNVEAGVGDNDAVRGARRPPADLRSARDIQFNRFFRKPAGDPVTSFVGSTCFPSRCRHCWTGERTSLYWCRLLPLVTVPQRFVLGHRGRIDRYVRVSILPKGEKGFV